MVLAFTTLTVTVFAAAASAFPLTQASSLKRHTGPFQPNISAAILDHTGVDITSSFEIMVYHEPEIVAKGNLTNRQSPLSRAINRCPVPRATFLRSYCDPETFVVGTLQRYTVICKRERTDIWTETATRLGVAAIVTTGDSAPIGPTIIERAGYCNFDEICITTRRHTSEANCVKITFFNRIMNSWNGAPSALEIVNTMAQGDTRHALDFGLGGTTASIMISDLNVTTPTEVDTFNVIAGLNGQIRQKEDQKKKCRDCVDLKTDKLKPNTKFLKTEARLLTAGAAAGIMWLAFMSG